MKTLLIGGGGTLGSYTAKELLSLGHEVDVIALEELTSDNPNLRYIRARVDDPFLQAFLAEHHYDVIVDFIHYPDPDAYKTRCPFLLSHAGRLVFLSSYRIYADEEHPIRETSPQLLDVFKCDAFLMENDRYGLSKSKDEKILYQTGYDNWTVVRPLISFSHFRLDLVTQGATTLLTRPKAGKKILLPKDAADLTAGLTWAGNTGKMIARLAVNENARGQAYTLGTGEENTWRDVADMYARQCGAQFEWVDTETYLKYATLNIPHDRVILCYDRLFDRKVDCSKVQAVTGLTTSDFTPVEDGLAFELGLIAEHPSERLLKTISSDSAKEVNRRMDEYFSLS